ncbi:MAG: hypothetical protein ACOY0T_33255 [Myxococcota bacterium]
MNSPAMARFAIAVAVASLFACARQTPAPHTPTTTAAEPTLAPVVQPAAAPPPDSALETVQLARLAVAVDLPDAGRWKDTGTARWVRLQHASTQSLLEISTSRERRLVQPTECEQRARLEHPDLPRPAEGEALEQRRIKLRGELSGQVTVSLDNVSADELAGHVTLFAAGIGRCLIAHFSTRVVGTTRDEEVARRLRLVVDRVMPSLTLLSADQRVQPEPFER